MADQRRYAIGRPMQEVRLKNWPAGQVSQLKRAIGYLEDELNFAMASQIAQGGKRVISDRIPIVTRLTIAAGFKNFQISFSEAQGITDLLFYEVQLDTEPQFPNPSTFTIPQTSLTLPADGSRETIYVRVRVVNSRFEAGPWSSTASATGSSNLRITVTRQDPFDVTVPVADFADVATYDATNFGEDDWVDVGGFSYQPTTAAVCLHIHAGVYVPIHTAIDERPGPAQSDSWSIQVAFRVLKNGSPFLEAGTMTFDESAEQENDGGEAEDEMSRIEGLSIGTLVTPFDLFLGNESLQTYTLQAKVYYTVGDTDATDVTIRVFALDALEVVTAS